MFDQKIYDTYFIPEALQAALLSYAEREHSRLHSPFAQAQDEVVALSASDVMGADAVWFESFPVYGVLQAYLTGLTLEKLQIIAGLAWYGRDYHSEGMQDQIEQIELFIDHASTTMKNTEADIRYLCEKPLHQYLHAAFVRLFYPEVYDSALAPPREDED